MSKTLLISEYSEPSDALDDLYPLEYGNSLEDRSLDYHFRMTYDFDDTSPDWEKDFYGEWRLTLLDTGRAPPGGTVLYSERHQTPVTRHGRPQLMKLYTRAKKLAQRLQDDETLHACEHCGWLHSDEDTRIVSWNPFNRSDYARPHDTDSRVDHCIGFESLFWPRLHIHTHDKRTNPFFDPEELEKCDTLTMARGYEQRQFSFRSDYYVSALKAEIERDPAVLREDLDPETFLAAIEYLTGETERRDITRPLHKQRIA